MTTFRSSRLLVPLLGVVIVLALAADALRRHLEHPVAPRARTAATAPRSPGGGVRRTGPDSGNQERAIAESSAAAAARAAVRERLRSDSAGSYLASMVTAADSVVHHWGARAGRPIRVAVVPWTATGYRDEYAGAVEWAVVRWNGVGLPVQFETTRDTSGADVVASWVDTLGGEAAGEARVVWRAPGEIVRARILLATHMPDGRAPTPNQMVTMALHELGHVLGLGHSPDRADALHPSSTAIELSERDRRTARLLYDLPSGSVKY